MTKTLGIDVSRWQDNNSTAQKMDFAKAHAAGARFVFIKASQQLWTDEDIFYNWKSAKAAGLLRGAYHFLTWDKPGRDQARYHWSIIQSDPGELPPVCDFEWGGTIPSNAYAILWEYLNELKMLCGRTPMIYTGYSFWMTYGNPAKLDWSQFPLWLAYYAAEEYVKIPAPWSKWTFWQYTSKGDGLAFGAESLVIDIDWFYGSYDELLVFANVPIPVTQPPAIDPHISQLENIHAELVDLRTRLDADLVARQNARAAAQAQDMAAHEAFVRELDYITNLSKPV